jgi:hypothetical protein
MVTRLSKSADVEHVLPLAYFVTNGRMKNPGER